MTRKQAEKIANAIAARARRAGIDKADTVDFPLADVAAALKKDPETLGAQIDENIPAIWGCMPFGWALGLVGSDLGVTRRAT